MGAKKKKVVNNNRGFATTSMPSKPRETDSIDNVLPQKPQAETSSASSGKLTDVTAQSASQQDPISIASTGNDTKELLSPEEFERRLEEGELQTLVDKHGQRVKRDAARQITRLITERRIQRAQADALNTRKWLPPDLIEEILKVVSLDDGPGLNRPDASAKEVSEEDLIVRLWTLRLVLDGAQFLDSRVFEAITHVMRNADNVLLGLKETIWGLDEALDYLARRCGRDELPDYDNLSRKPKYTTNTEMVHEPPHPLTPQTQDKNHSNGSSHTAPKAAAKDPAKGRKVVEYDSDIDPEELMPVYLATKEKLFHLQSSKSLQQMPAVNTASGGAGNSLAERRTAVTKLQRKLKQIEGDILFDQYLADIDWQKRHIVLEREAAASRAGALGQPARAKHPAESDSSESSEDGSGESDIDDVSKAAKQMAKDILAENESDDDDAIADLFASLPTTEVDPISGKSNTVINGSDGVKVIIRDFGTSTGVSARRVLEEACRARDGSVRFHYSLLSSASFSNRSSLRISWSKAQESPPTSSVLPGIDCTSTPKTTSITMTTISTPTTSQSEAYVATAALFLIFSVSQREEKVYMRLPVNWRELYVEMLGIKKDQTDTMDRDTIRGFRDQIRARRDREEEDGVVLTTTFRRKLPISTPTDTSDEGGGEKSVRVTPMSEELQRIWQDKSSTAQYQQMLRTRQQLPMWQFREDVLSAIDREQIVIICGETGCGKSTQVPAFILEHQLSQGKSCRIYCTEPRRISAISLARRVSEELGERRNDIGTPRSLVGFAIRLESNVCRETRLIYATTGIVMRMLEGSGDLKDITHIILDEVHERTIDSDFLLIILRKLLVRRKDLKVILMSATVDAGRFSKYLDGAPVLQVPGRTFPVATRYLEDAVELTGYAPDHAGQPRRHEDDDDLELDETPTSTSKADIVQSLAGYSNRTKNTITQLDEYRIEFDLVINLLCRIAADEQFTPFSKAILVFLPGIGEIRQLNDMLSGHPVFNQGWYIYPLHSTISSEDQEAAFMVPPAGTRKIVLSTNIAETGVTIPDVTCVIDTGKHREMRFDERRQLSRLLETFISRANAKQRRGRAGRVQEGLCFHMFTKHRHDKIMADQQTPELLRLSLQELAIRVKVCKLGGIEETLNEALDPPSAKNIRRAIDALIDVRALTAAEELTPLGTQLAKLPLDVFLGKLIILGSIFKCLDATVTIAAILSSKSPFVTPFGARAQADTIRLAFRKGDSDLLTVYNAYLAWKKVCILQGSDFQFCRKNFLSPQTLSNIEDLKGQILSCIVDSGFLPLTADERALLSKTRFTQGRKRLFFDVPQRANGNSDNELITTSVIGWSFYPKLLTKDGKGWRNVANNQSVSLHPSSVNKGHQELQWLSYYHIMQAKQFYNAHETTAVQDFAIALLCGDVRADLYAGVLTVDGNRARFAISDWKTMLVIKTLRSKLRDVMTRSFKTPGKPLTSPQQRWMELWQKIFSQEPLLQAKGYANQL